MQALVVLWLLGACQRPASKGGMVVDKHFFENLDSAAAHPRSVKTLFLSRQGIATLPTSIQQLTNLETLIVSGNPHLNVADLIYKIKDLRKLKSLDLSACQLDSLPVQVGLLQHVVVLNLSNNHLTSLPSNIRDMHSLREVVFCQYEEEFRQWPREEKLRAVALVPHGHVILLDCFGGVHGRYRLGKLRVKVTEHKLWQ